MAEQNPYTDQEYGQKVISPMLFGANQLAKRGELGGVLAHLRRIAKKLLAHMEEERRSEGV